MRIRSAVLLTVLLASAASAQIAYPGSDENAPPKVELKGSVSKRAGDLVEGVITTTIPAPWHVNSNKPLDEFLIPTVLTLDPATAELTSAQYPQHELKAFGFSGGSKLAVYEGTIQIPFTAKLKPGANTIRASLRYQSCNDKVCLPPKTVSAEFSTTPSGAPALSPASSSAFTPLSSAPKDAVPKDRLAATFATSGLPLTLLVLFVLGIALNLTPCVFPMIPITLGFFAMQSDGRRSRRLALSSLYVLGIVIMYSALGVVAALGGKMFGAWLQSTSVQVGFAALMLVLASSMFGAFDITVPQFIANRAMGRAGLAGAMTMGLLVGIVAAPCVGPVVVSLITLVASLGSPLLGFVMFASLALGLGFPYLIALNALPRPGEWMVQVKKAMGFVLVAMAFYFLRPLAGDDIFRWGAAISLLIGAAFLFFSRTQGGRVMRLSCASLLLVAGAAFAFPRGGAKSTVSWDRYDAKRLASARGAKPVVIDFYADWCLPCKELDEKTFADIRVANELQRFSRIKADLTAAEDPTTKALTKQYGIVGVPTIVFLDAAGNEVSSARLTGFESAEKFLPRAQSVK
ncbi:MAG: cytochrome c biogenesis protein CcdA [Thermoanaerobaculia bacterium]